MSAPRERNGEGRAAALSRFAADGTTVLGPDHWQWRHPTGAPPASAEEVALIGDPDGVGPYLMAMRWHPGFFSGPHRYDSDRDCMVLSGTWWVGAGDALDWRDAVPVQPGSVVRRAAGTSHWDGVVPGAAGPAVIAIWGIAPVRRQLVDPGLPLVRPVGS